MNLNKKLIIVVFAVIFASCSTNNNIQVIDSENIKIEELEKILIELLVMEYCREKENQIFLHHLFLNLLEIIQLSCSKIFWEEDSI